MTDNNNWHKNITEIVRMGGKSYIEFSVADAEIIRLRASLADAYERAAKIVEDEGECRHVDHVQGFCACESKAAAIRALKETQT